MYKRNRLDKTKMYLEFFCPLGWVHFLLPSRTAQPGSQECCQSCILVTAINVKINNFWICSNLKSKTQIIKGVEYYEPINKQKKNRHFLYSLLKIVLTILAVSEWRNPLHAMNAYCNVIFIWKVENLTSTTEAKMSKNKFQNKYRGKAVESFWVTHFFSAVKYEHRTDRSRIAQKENVMSFLDGKNITMYERGKKMRICVMVGIPPTLQSIKDSAVRLLALSRSDLIWFISHYLLISLSVHHAGLPLSHISLTRQSLSQKVNNQRTLKHGLSEESPPEYTHTHTLSFPFKLSRNFFVKTTCKKICWSWQESRKNVFGQALASPDLF